MLSYKIQDFDNEAVGRLLRSERKMDMKASGFRSSDAWREELNRRTGSNINRAQLLRFEGGRQQMKMDELLAICIYLYGDDWRNGIIRFFEAGMPFDLQLAYVQESLRQMRKDPVTTRHQIALLKNKLDELRSANCAVDEQEILEIEQLVHVMELAINNDDEGIAFQKAREIIEHEFEERFYEEQTN